jgi:hypothetical protein
MNVRQRSMRSTRSLLFSLLFSLLVLPAACHVDATVGYNESAFASGLSCKADAVARCEQGVCAVSTLFNAPAGHVTLEADDTELFYSTGLLSIGRRPIAGGPTLELGSSSTSVRGMTSDATHVYWTELSGVVRGVEKNGGAPFDASYVVGNPTELTVDTTHLYWVFPDGGRVAMAPKPSGEATHIGGQDVPRSITTDGTHVYWVNAGSAPAAGQLMRASRGDLTTAEVVLSDLDAPLAVTATRAAIYWASKTAVFRLMKGEAAAQTVTTGLTEITQIGVHGSFLYGVGMDGLWKVPAVGGERNVLHPRPMSALAISCSGVFAVHWLEDGLERYGPRQ